MSRIFWDTNIFIYFIEDHPVFAEKVKQLHNHMRDRRDTLVTSAMTLAEIQVPARRAGDLLLAQRYRETIRRMATVVSFDQAVADRFAEIRVVPSVRPADAIQLSCAAAAGVEVFITNDQSLTRLRVDGIHFITKFDRYLGFIN